MADFPASERNRILLALARERVERKRLSLALAEAEQELLRIQLAETVDRLLSDRLDLCGRCLRADGVRPAPPGLDPATDPGA